MTDFDSYLSSTEEIGFVRQIVGSMIYAEGLPTAHPGEVVLFEFGGMGYVLGLTPVSVEILLLSAEDVLVGTRIARTGSTLRIKTGKEYLGTILTSDILRNEVFIFNEDAKNHRPVDGVSTIFTDRKNITQPLETGVTVVDLLVPLGIGQRELIIGDRKTGKSNFLLQTIRTQVAKNCICIYATIAKPQLEIDRIIRFFKENNLMHRSVIVASNADHRAGLIYLTPYVAMTMAEHFRDKGENVILILDDLTTHARYYREIMLSAKRFPGRNSYPGDIFHIHARLLERAGNFQKGSLTCLPVGQSILGDLSGYVQTNLMSITDGHIFFDNDFFDQGRRPAINPFLSVTRVGEQTQTPLVQEIGRLTRSFLTQYDKVKQFKHFQSELNEKIRILFDMGDRTLAFLDQSAGAIVPLNCNLILYGALWSDFWKNTPIKDMKYQMNQLTKAYLEEEEFRQQADVLISQSNTIEKLKTLMKANRELLSRHVSQEKDRVTEAGVQGSI